MRFRKAAVLSVLLSMLFAFNNQAYAATSNTRFAGKDRYGTSTAISKNGWKETSDYAVIAYGEDFPDALTAAPLAKKYNAPILLTSKDKLGSGFADASDIKVADELKRLKVKKVFIVGGTGVVSDKVVEEIKALNTNNGQPAEVERIAGQDRVQTSIEVAKRIGTDKGIVVTTGLDFADALSISPIAAAKEMPVVLVQTPELAQDVKAFLNERNYLVKEGGNTSAPKAYLIGGTGVVSADIEKEFANKERLAGQNAYQTNVSVLTKFEKDIDFSTAFISTRNDFPDALAGSALASTKISPIILTGDIPDSATTVFMNSKFDAMKQINVLGGEGAVKADTIQKLVIDTMELKELLNASINTMNIKSAEGKSEITLKLDVKGLPKEEQEEVNAMLELIKNTKITVDSKSSSNDAKTLAKSYVDLKADSFLGPINLSMWMDMDMTGTTPKFKEIIKLPEMFTTMFPEEYASKEYMVIDSADMPADESAAGFVDFKEFAQINKEFQEKLIKFMEGYISQPGNKDFISFKGEQSVTTPDGAKNARLYEVKLNNEVLEKFMAYMDAEESDIKALKDANIFGDKGIVLDYYIADGIIVASNISINLHIDLAELDSLFGALEPGAEEPVQADQGIIDLELNISSKTFNINKDMNIVFPQLTPENSFNAKELEGMEDIEF